MRTHFPVALVRSTKAWALLVHLEYSLQCKLESFIGSRQGRVDRYKTQRRWECSKKLDFSDFKYYYNKWHYCPSIMVYMIERTFFQEWKLNVDTITVELVAFYPRMYEVQPEGKGQEDLSCTLGKKIGDINKGQCLDRIRDNQITTREPSPSPQRPGV